MASFSSQRRRGLPRIPGGEPWPPAAHEAEVDAGLSASAAGLEQPAEPTEASASPAASALAGQPRRGLPRVPGGEAWPPVVVVNSAEAPSEVTGGEHVPEPAVEPAPGDGEELTPVAEENPEPAAEDDVVMPEPVSAQPEAAKPDSTIGGSREGSAPRAVPSSGDGSSKTSRWIRRVLSIGIGSILAAALLVLAARGVTTLPGVPEFMERYPGQYELPDSTEPGFPAWARWSHYLNFFFLLLIIRTGLLVRTQQRPDAFYTPKRGGKKVSIYLWLHTSIDILWLLNGVAFVVLLFVTGHWGRLVPTSWEVFPNAASAGLQYMSLQWPVHDSWVNYNSLQELMYFTVVFIAAPLAVITGARLSEWWPKEGRLSRILPITVARALHFPVMLFFVFFVILHVVLVLATGALKNLNQMFYGVPEVSWTGFWIFAAGLAVAIAAVAAVRPLLIAPVASLFGRVSNR